MLPSGFIFLQRDWLSSNSLLIYDKNSSFLFDSGYVTHSAQLLQLVRHQLGSQPLGVVGFRHAGGAHFVDNDRYASPRDLPSGFATGQTAADNMNG